MEASGTEVANGGDASDCTDRATGVTGSTDLDKYLGLGSATMKDSHEKVSLTELISSL